MTTFTIIIELLLKSAGYKGTGSLLSDPLYPLLICQFSNGSFDHGSDFQNQADLIPFIQERSIRSSRFWISPQELSMDAEMFAHHRNLKA